MRCFWTIRSTEAYNIDVLTSDQFLAHQSHLNRELLEEKLRGHAKARGFARALVQRLAKWRRLCRCCSWNLRSY